MMRLSTLCLRAEMYSLLLETYIKDSQQKQHLFHAIDTIPCIRRKADWAMKWITRCTAAVLGCVMLRLRRWTRVMSAHMVFMQCMPNKWLSCRIVSVRSSDSFAERLVAFAAVEGIFFSGR